MINPGDLKSIPEPDKGCCKQLSIWFMEKVKNPSEAFFRERLNRKTLAQASEATSFPWWEFRNTNCTLNLPLSCPEKMKRKTSKYCAYQKCYLFLANMRRMLWPCYIYI